LADRARRSVLPRLSVVIRNLDFIGISGLPSKTNAILLVYPDAVLALSFPAQALKPISWRDSQLV